MIETSTDSPPKSADSEGSGVGQHRLVRHLDLFSGIGGFALAAKMVGGIETVGFCEIDPWAQKVLAKNFPGVPIHDDIHTLKSSIHDEIRIITGGFPCQPYSTAGKQGGSDDDRAIWPEMLRVINESRPTWVLGENVAGIKNLDLERVLSDLEGSGYGVEAFDIPACGVSARHSRHRIWIVGYRYFSGDRRLNLRPGSGGSEEGGRRQTEKGSLWEHIAAPTWGREGASDKPGLVRRIHGVSNRMDRYRGLANAIVPQVAAQILRCMMRVDSLANDQGMP